MREKSFTDRLTVQIYSNNSTSQIYLLVEHSVQGDMLELAVADEGKGVPAEERESIFEKFRQSASDSQEAQSQGSGLGLAIVKAIVTAHGGSAGVRPNAPSGSVFWFNMPL